MKEKLKQLSSVSKKIIKSGSIREMIGNIPCRSPEYIIFIFLFMFMALPFYQFFIEILLPPLKGTYGINVNTVHRTTLLLGIASFVISAAKKITEKRPLRPSNNIPMMFFGFTALMALLSTFVNGFTDYALSGDPYRRENLYVFLLYFLIYFPCASLIKGKK